MTYLRCGLAVALFLPFAAQSQADSLKVPETVVSASRIPTARENVGSSVTVITAEELENQQATTVYEALHQVPGVTVNNSGGVGRQTSVRIRGAQDSHTLVLINGMEVNDPSSIGGSFDFGTLSTAAIQRIEVVRGAQSGIYGSDAIGGVINIITKRGEKGFHSRAEAEAGSFNTRRGLASVSGGNPWVDFALTAQRYMTDGISAASEDRGATENDPHRQTTLQGRLGVNPVENLTLDATFRYIDSRTEFDAGAGMDDPNDRTERLERYGRISAKYKAFKNRWTQELGYGYTNIWRSSFSSPSSTVFWFQGKKEKVDYHSILQVTKGTDLVAGWEYEQERIDTQTGLDRTVDNWAYFGEIRQRLGGAHLSLAGRRDKHETFGNHGTYRATLSYRVPRVSTRLHASYGTGFKAPTPFQLFSGSGNPNLDPETSRSWDVGFEQPFLEGAVTLEATYFHNRFEDLITFVRSPSPGTYTNVNEARSRGVETGITIKPLQGLRIRGSGTWLKAENLTTGNQLVSRPGHQAHLRVDYSFTGGATVTAQLRHRGEQPDFAGTSQSFTVMDLALEVPAGDNWSLRGRIENVWDEDYEEVFGFGTRGRSAFVTVAAHY